MDKAKIDSLKKGDKVIFTRFGGVFSAYTGRVFTFSNWFTSRHFTRAEKCWFQVEELHAQGNHMHNFNIWDTDIFDPVVYPKHEFANSEVLERDMKEFIRDYGE